MQQYLDLLKHIKENGEYKSPARDNMPSTKSIFGYQMRFDLSKGFPIVTTKKVSFKNIVIELLWFLRGDTNIKYLIDNGCNIWNEDAYNYYKKFLRDYEGCPERVLHCNGKEMLPLTFEGFVESIKNDDCFKSAKEGDYQLGDCGYQYGKVWRRWEKWIFDEEKAKNEGYWKEGIEGVDEIDQITNLIKSLKETPESRRHILTSIDPAHSEDLALFWCHALAQFNCRLLSNKERCDYLRDTNPDIVGTRRGMFLEEWLDSVNAPKYKLDCHLYQRSADVFLGVPYNISSYALLTHILAKICNMQVGELVHTFGDVHIYDNHESQVEEQLKREPMPLPTLEFSDKFNFYTDKFNGKTKGHFTPDFGIKDQFDNYINSFNCEDFRLKNYQHHPAIKADLSTGLKKCSKQ